MTERHAFSAGGRLGADGIACADCGGDRSEFQHVGRREFLRRGAALGLGAWVAPSIVSFHANPAMPSHRATYSCCACYRGDPHGRAGEFLGARTGSGLLDCEAFCESLAPAGSGAVLVFSASAPLVAQPAYALEPGCHYGGAFLDREITHDSRGAHSVCPRALPAGVTGCEVGYW